jgi:hypothetical protein
MGTAKQRFSGTAWPSHSLETSHKPWKEIAMTPENNTIQAPAATISEKELWAIFVRNVVQTSLGAGTVIERYKPDEYLRECGSWGGLLDFSNELADSVAEAASPSEELSTRLEEIECYGPLLRIVADDFDRFKASMLLEDADNDEAEARYRAPVASEAA